MMKETRSGRVYRIEDVSRIWKQKKAYDEHIGGCYVIAQM